MFDHIYGYPVHLIVEVDGQSYEILSAFTCPAGGVVAVDTDRVLRAVSDIEAKRAPTFRKVSFNV